MISGGVHISPDIRLTAEENTENPQLGYRRMMKLCDQSLPQKGSLFSSDDFDMIAQHARKGEERKEGKASDGEIDVLNAGFSKNEITSLDMRL